MDQKCRPTAKELLIDPFILKSKGPALLSELVTRSLESIQQMRQGWEKDSHKSIEVDVGMHTYVKASGTIKMQSEKKKNSVLEQEGELIPLYE